MEKLGAQLADLSAKQLDGVAAWLAVRKKPIDRQLQTDMDINRNWTAEHDDNDDDRKPTKCLPLAYLHVSVYDFDSN